MSWHICVSSSGVGQSAGLVVCNCMVPGPALSGILASFAVCWTSLFCVIKNQCLPFYSIIILIIILHKTPCGIQYN